MLYLDLLPYLKDKNQEEDSDSDEEDQSLNLPFNLYVEGSYFGDSDCLLEKDASRECMA